MEDIENGQPNWPKWFLIGHAIELAINAFVVSRENLDAPPRQKPARHDLVGLYEYAVQYGLKRNPLVTSELDHISIRHRESYARYPKAYARPVVLIGQFDDLVDQLFADIAKAT